VDGVRRSVQVEGDFTSIQELENVIIKAENGFIVHLRDVAHVAFVEKEKESYAREYLRPVVSLDVVKRAGENLLEASSAINAIIEEAKRDVLPRNLNVSITNDQSDMTQTQVEELQNSIIFGVLLVVGVLLFFLGLRNALFVGVAIPLSMFMSFLILNSLGVTFNTMEPNNKPTVPKKNAHGRRPVNAYFKKRSYASSIRGSRLFWNTRVVGYSTYVLSRPSRPATMSMLPNAVTPRTKNITPTPTSTAVAM